MSISNAQVTKLISKHLVIKTLNEFNIPEIDQRVTEDPHFLEICLDIILINNAENV